MATKIIQKLPTVNTLGSFEVFDNNGVMELHLNGVSVLKSQQGAITSLTDTSGGTPSDTLTIVGVTYDQATMANSIASLAAKIESLTVSLRNMGIIAT